MEKWCQQVKDIFNHCQNNNISFKQMKKTVEFALWLSVTHFFQMWLNLDHLENSTAKNVEGYIASDVQFFLVRNFVRTYQKMTID